MADAVSYLVSALAFFSIRTPEADLIRPARQTALKEIREAVGVVRTSCSTTSSGERRSPSGSAVAGSRIT